MKKIISLIAVFTLSMAAMAQNASLKVTCRDGKFLSFQMTNDFDVYGVGFKVKLPEGVTIATKVNDDDEEVPQIKKNTTRAKGADYKLYIDNIPGGGYSINLSNLDAPFIGSEGEILYIELAGTLSGVVEVYDINFCDNANPQNSYYVNGDKTYKIQVELGTAPASPVELKGEVDNGSLVFTFKNNSGKTIANCNFQLQLPEGVSVKPKGKKYAYEEGDATEGMTFSVAYNATSNKYTITVYDGEFDESLGNTIISLPLEGTLSGVATVSSIAFGDPDANNICRPEAFTIDLGTAINSISADETKSGVIYNLSGQRVSKAVNGIFIIDGKKVAVTK